MEQTRTGKMVFKRVLRPFHKKREKQCNICGKSFRSRLTRDRFCGSCKSHSEVYRYSEWLPLFSVV